MRRLSCLASVLLLLASACGSSGTESTPTSSPGSSVAASAGTSVATAATTAPPATTAATTTTAAVAASPPSIDDLLASGDILNVAHAGGDQDYPHSTLYAYARAAAAGADVLELDVQLSADGEVMVQHDDTVDRTTESTGKVAELTVGELQALDAAYWFSSVCWRCDDLPVEAYEFRGVRTGDVPPPDGFSPDDFSMATLRQLSERFPNHPLDIEIKLPDGDTTKGIEVAEALAAELIALDRLDSTVVVSFDDAVVDAFHAAAPTVAVSPGLDRLTDWFLNNTPLEDQFKIIQVPPFSSGIQVVSAETVQRAHDEGLTVWVWPDAASWQETEAYYQQILGYGADAVLAGRPAQMTSARAKGPFVVPASSGCGTAPEPGTVTKTVSTTEGDRTYLQFAPSSYDGTRPTPIVLDFHGFTASAESQAALSGFDAVAETNGFLVVSPEGTGVASYWNVIGSPELTDDVAFVSDLLDQLEADLCIDTSRVYASGMSNGGYMSSRLACDLSDRIAAIAPVAATTFFDDCTPTRAVPVMSIHGDNDQVVPFAGVDTGALESAGLATIEADPAALTMLAELFSLNITDEVEQWADHNSCGTPVERAIGSDVIHLDFQGCAAPVDFYIVDDGGHTWPGSDVSEAIGFLGYTTFDIQATEIAWSFFRQHRLG